MSPAARRPARVRRPGPPDRPPRRRNPPPRVRTGRPLRASRPAGPSSDNDGAAPGAVPGRRRREQDGTPTAGATKAPDPDWKTRATQACRDFRDGTSTRNAAGSWSRPPVARRCAEVLRPVARRSPERRQAHRGRQRRPRRRRGTRRGPPPARSPTGAARPRAANPRTPPARPPGQALTPPPPAGGRPATLRACADASASCFRPLSAPGPPGGYSLACPRLRSARLSCSRR